MRPFALASALSGSPRAVAFPLFSLALPAAPAAAGAAPVSVLAAPTPRMASSGDVPGASRELVLAPLAQVAAAARLGPSARRVFDGSGRVSAAPALILASRPLARVAHPLSLHSGAPAPSAVPAAAGAVPAAAGVASAAPGKAPNGPLRIKAALILSALTYHLLYGLALDALPFFPALGFTVLWNGLLMYGFVKKFVPELYPVAYVSVAHWLFALLISFKSCARWGCAAAILSPGAAFMTAYAVYPYLEKRFAPLKKEDAERVLRAWPSLEGLSGDARSRAGKWARGLLGFKGARRKALIEMSDHTVADKMSGMLSALARVEPDEDLRNLISQVRGKISSRARELERQRRQLGFLAPKGGEDEPKAIAEAKLKAQALRARMDLTSRKRAEEIETVLRALENCSEAGARILLLKRLSELSAG